MGWKRTSGSFSTAWRILRQKLTGHFRYYGISGNMDSIKRYQVIAVRLVRKWLNWRNQRRIYYRKRFRSYLTRFPEVLTAGMEGAPRILFAFGGGMGKLLSIFIFLDG